MTEYIAKRLKPDERIKQILQLPERDYTVIEYMSGERKIVKRKV
jgi:hypothetical protein